MGMKMRSRALGVAVWLAIAVLADGGLAAAVEQEPPLVEAVKNRNMVAARALLRQQVDVNVPQADGATALQWAAHWDDLETAELLIRAGALVNAANHYGVSPLELACTNGSAPMVKMLLKGGAIPNTVFSTGETPIMRAARVGNVDTVKVLHAHGADVNAKESSEEQTALMWAVAEKHLEVARVLIEAGADVHARSRTLKKPKATGSYYAPTLQPYGGYTPLLFAARENNLDVVRLLLAAGANVNDAAADGVTPLLVATVRGHVELAAALMERGADPNLDGAGYTALHWAAGVWESSLTSGVVGIEPQPRNQEWTALAGLQEPAKLDLVKALLAHGADPNARIVKNPPRFGYTVCSMNVSFPGATPFFLAAMAADVDVMRVLLASGADPLLALDSPNNTTPLMAAAGLFWCVGESRATEPEALGAVRLALDVGASINAANGEGRTALLAAAASGWDSVVEFLAGHGADVNRTDRHGNTAVMLAGAVRMGKPSYKTTVELLRKLGAE